MKDVAAKNRAALIKAAKKADWQQVVLNGGPPCFYLDGDRFCLRAERWHGPGTTHGYVPLDEMLCMLVGAAND